MVAVSTQQKDIFICHASEDKLHVVRPLYEHLESKGFNIWYDEAEIKWGDSITERVNWGLIHSRYVVVVLSENFLDKKWPNREFNSVVNSESSSGVVKVLPLLVGDFEVIEKIKETYPLINDKRYLQWSDNKSEIVGELFKIFPERRSVKSKNKKGKAFNRSLEDIKVLGNADISIDSQTVFQLTDASEEGVFVKPGSVNGIPFQDVFDNFYEQRKGATLLAKFLDKATWLALNNQKASSLKLFVEIPALYSETCFLKEFFNALITDAGLDNKDVVVLIPEALMINGGEGGSVVMQALKAQGIKIGLSQFGTGYSSLSDLRKFGFHYLFVDSSFLMGATSDKTDFVILKAMGSLAKSLNMILAVDCVKTQDQKELLKSIGCQLIASPTID